MKSGNATMILLIIALVVGIASTALIITISRANPKTQSSATAPVDTLLPSVPKSSASGQTKFPTPTTPPPATTTPAGATLPSGTITTKTSLSADKTMLAVDFIAANFTSFTSIAYTVTYTADVSAVATTKNIQGTFSPAGTLITGYQSTGYPYIRKTFTLGTCSGTNCTYDTNPRTFTVAITTN